MIPERRFTSDCASLYREYGDIIFGCAKAFTEDDLLAAEILKSSLECIAGGEKQFDTSKMTFLTYILQIVREKAIEALNNPLNGTVYSFPRSNSTFLQVAEMLSPLHRNLFHGRYFEGKSESLLAAQTGLTEMEIKIKLREIVRKLRAYLQ